MVPEAEEEVRQVGEEDKVKAWSLDERSREALTQKEKQ